MSFTFDLHSLVSKYIPASIRRERLTPDTDSAGIPFSNRDDIDALRQEYEDKTRSAQDPTLESCFNYCWALVHSRDKSDVTLGLQLVEALLSHPEDGLNQRELLYLKAVGMYRRGENLEARQTLKALLEAHPDFRQAETLLEHVESEVVKDGIIGLTAGAAILGVVTTVAIAAASGSRKR